MSKRMRRMIGPFDNRLLNFVRRSHAQLTEPSFQPYVENVHGRS